MSRVDIMDELRSKRPCKECHGAKRFQKHHRIGGYVENIECPHCKGTGIESEVVTAVCNGVLTSVVFEPSALAAIERLGK